MERTPPRRCPGRSRHRLAVPVVPAPDHRPGQPRPWHPDQGAPDAAGSARGSGARRRWDRTQRASRCGPPAQASTSASEQRFPAVIGSDQRIVTSSVARCAATDAVASALLRCTETSAGTTSTPVLTSTTCRHTPGVLSSIISGRPSRRACAAALWSAARGHSSSSAQAARQSSRYAVPGGRPGSTRTVGPPGPEPARRRPAPPSRSRSPVPDALLRRRPPRDRRHHVHPARRPRRRPVLGPASGPGDVSKVRRNQRRGGCGDRSQMLLPTFTA